MGDDVPALHHLEVGVIRREPRRCVGASVPGLGEKGSSHLDVHIGRCVGEGRRRTRVVLVLIAWSFGVGSLARTGDFGRRVNDHGRLLPEMLERRAASWTPGNGRDERGKQCCESFRSRDRSLGLARDTDVYNDDDHEVTMTTRSPLLMACRTKLLPSMRLSRGLTRWRLLIMIVEQHASVVTSLLKIECPVIPFHSTHNGGTCYRQINGAIAGAIHYFVCPFLVHTLSAPPHALSGYTEHRRR